MKLTALCALLLPFVLAGCVVESLERDSLPTGVTLLDSDDGHCDGVLEIEGSPDLTVDAGEETVIAVDDGDDIEWECLADYEEEDGEFDCPVGTSYIRVWRDEDDPEFTMECYGA